MRRWQQIRQMAGLEGVIMGFHTVEKKGRRRKGLVRERTLRWLVWIGAGAVAAAAIWRFSPVAYEAGQTLVRLMPSVEEMEQFVAWLGWMGPPVLILLHALQIVVAPVPAYALFGIAGILYGPLWGGLYATVGTLLGATAAMLLTRRSGRPLAARLVGEEWVNRWNALTVNQSLLAWGLLLLAPIGDLPYFLAGLSPIRLFHILALTLLTRVPSIFLVAAAGSEVTSLAGPQLALLFLGLLVGFLLFLRYRAPVLAWFARQLGQQEK